MQRLRIGNAMNLRLALTWLLLIGAVGTELLPSAHAQDEDAATSKANGIKRVLFIVSDDLKASTLGFAGDEFARTPNLDALASRAMVFERAYCQGTWCLPSRKSFMFSRYQDADENAADQVNLGQHFRSNGWYSARVGKIYHMRVPGDIIDGTNGPDIANSWTERFNSPGPEAHTPGDYACLNLNVFTNAAENRQSTAMPHRMFVTVEQDGDGSDQPDFRSATKAIELMGQHQDEPFFLAVGFVRPHYPMVAPRAYFAKHPWEAITLPEAIENDLADMPKLGIAGMRNDNNGIGKFPDNQKRMWQGYYASIAFMDTQVGRLLAELDRLGLRDSTAIVFTSDHGYHLGEHGFWQKSNLHEDVLRVPMIVSAPGFAPGRSQSLVELVDVFPTLCDLVGLDVPASVQGTSLLPILRDPAATVKPAAMSFDKGISYRTDDWHLMRYKDGAMELYDMRNDPKQFTNLAGSAEHSDKLAELQAALDARLNELDLSEDKINASRR